MSQPINIINISHPIVQHGADTANMLCPAYSTMTTDRWSRECATAAAANPVVGTNIGAATLMTSQKKWKPEAAGIYKYAVASAATKRTKDRLVAAILAWAPNHDIKQLIDRGLIPKAYLISADISRGRQPILNLKDWRQSSALLEAIKTSCADFLMIPYKSVGCTHLCQGS